MTTPNNPTGGFIPIEAITELAQSAKLVGALLVVDEAYAEFSNETSAVSLIPNFENIVVVRTMSKAFALAGARIGYLIGNSKIVEAAIEAPLKQIAINAGLEGGVIVEKVRNQKPGFGLNAATGEYVDMIKEGIIDPAKVTRSALQNAASIAALFLTTEAVIADKPEPKAAAMPSPDGGMDF